MPSEKITFQDFEIKLVNIFGKPLNEKAKLAAIDFCVEGFSKYV